MKISKKLALFYVAVLAAFCLLSVAMIMQMRQLTSGYDAVLNTSVREMDQARVIQVDFKKQVQEWKDILLRGHTPEDLTKYTQQFHEREALVRSEAKALAEQCDDQSAKQFLDEFLDAHQVLSQKYQQAYDAYVAGNFDFKNADRLMRGQDRAPTDLFDQVVTRLENHARDSIAGQRRAASRNRNLALAAAGGFLLLLGFVGLWIVTDVIKRLGRLKEVSDRLAVADVSGLVVKDVGNDEIGEFGRSLAGVHAAIEELLNSARQTAAKY